MAQQPAANENTPLLTPVHLHLSMEEQAERRDARTISSSPGSNTVIQPSIEGELLSSPTSSGSSTTVQRDDEDESAPLLVSASQHSTTEHQLEGGEPNTGATFDPPRVKDENEHRFLSWPNAFRQRASSLAQSFLTFHFRRTKPHSIPNAFAQQVKIHQQRPFSLSDPAKSSIMLRRNPHAESASAGRTSTSKETLQNLNPKRVKKLIDTLGFDDQRSELFYKLVLATAPFHNIEPLSTAPAPENRNPQADALREALGTLIFAPKPASPIASPPATVAENGSSVGDGSKNPTTNRLFDAVAAENLGSRAREASSDSPPLLWSTAAAEDSLDPNAEEPTCFTAAEFLNTIIENKIQVESVNDEDWWIEDMRVKILDQLVRDISEEVPVDEEDSGEVVMTKDEAIKEVKAKESKVEESKSEEIKAKETKPNKTNASEIEDEGVKANQDTSGSDLQRWKGQGPGDWLRKDDGTDMDGKEIDEECARWDAMVREAENEKKRAQWGAMIREVRDENKAGKWSGFYSNRLQ